MVMRILKNPNWAGFGVRGHGDHLESQGTKKDVNLSKFRKASSRILTGLELG
jgi:hypothetical protein